LSIHLLLSLRAARRRRDQHFTSRRPGRTTGRRAAAVWLGRLAWLGGGLALLALALAWSLRPLVHDDLFLHLRTGEWIAGRHRVPLVDLFSYTRHGARWITHEWGFSLLACLVHRAAGAAGLVALTPALALAIFAAVAWRALELARPAPPAADAAPSGSPGPTGPAGPAGGLLLMALLGAGWWAASPEIFLRAALAGELMLALALAALARYRRTGRRAWLAAVAGIFWLWANLHSGVIFGLYVLALYALEPLAVALLRRRGRAAAPAGAAAAGRPALPWRAAAPGLLTLAAAAILTLVNPNGVAAPLYPFLLARILYASGIPWELGHFSASAPGGAAADAPLWLLLVLLLLALLPLRQARRLSAAEAVSVATFVVLTALSRRFVFDLVVIGLPTLYKLLVLPPPPALPGGPAAAEERTARVGAPSRLRDVAGAGHPGVAAALIAAFLLPVAPGAIAGTAAEWVRRPPARGGLIGEPLPAAAARFLVAERLAGPADRIFNHQNYGGFIGWKLGVPMFWDGRNDVFAELVREVATRPFGDTARRHGIDYLLIAEHDAPGIQPEIAAGRWGLVYWDDFCAIYLRRGARYAEPLRRLELRLFPAFGGRPGLAALAADPGLARAARAELGQVLAANPANQRALYFAGVISLHRGELRRAAAELGAARRIRPSDQVDLALDWLRRLGSPPAGETPPGRLMHGM
jgi:hypothetical protein